MSEHSKNSYSERLTLQQGRDFGRSGVWFILICLLFNSSFLSSLARSQDLPTVAPLQPSSYSGPTIAGPMHGEFSELAMHGEYSGSAHTQYSGSAHVAEGFPRIRKLGKLVSIEGKQGGLRSVRELQEGEAGPALQTGTEFEIDANDGSTPMVVPRLSYFHQEPFTNYRVDESAFSYMPGNGDQFGWISFESQPYLKSGYRSGITNSINMHLLAGPDAVPLPPRLFDFSLGYQKRGRVADVLSFDLATSVGVFSDFEDSAREGVRFPGHAVGMLHYSPEADLVFGVDYLSRDDTKLLPVAGISFRPRKFENLRFDLVFPRPRIDYTFVDQSKMYLAGRLGGGTWDIEFPSDANDVMTYRDLQLLLGFEHRNSDGDLTVWEFGYVFDRSLEFRTLVGKTEFDDAFVFRIVTRK
ncbi:MAG: hypothetical protein ABL921_03260 [Pirellula sp.]